MNESITPEEIIDGIGTPAEHSEQPIVDEPTNIVTIYPESTEYSLVDPKLVVASPLTPEEVNAAVKKVEEKE